MPHINSTDQSRVSRFGPPAFYALFFFVLLGQGLLAALTGGLSMPGDPNGDLAAFFFPTRDFLGGSLRSGLIPLWNPYLFAGMPYPGVIQSAIFYPWNWLHAILPTAVCLNLTLWAHLTWGAWGMERLCRKAGAAWHGAALGGLTFGASGFLIGHLYAGHLTFICAAAWAPWVARALCGRSGIAFREWLCAGLALGAQILAGAPQISAMTLGAGLFLALWQSFRRNAPGAGWAARLKPVAAWFGIAAIGFALAFAQILPAMGWMPETIRSQPLPEASAFLDAAPLENLASLAFPALMGPAHSGQEFGAGRQMEIFAPLGVLALALGAAALAFQSPFRPTACPFACLAFLGLALSSAAFIPVWNFLDRLAPVARIFHAPGRFLFLWTLGGPVVVALGASAALGVDEVPRELRRRWGKATLLAGIAVALAGFALLFPKGAESDILVNILRFKAPAPLDRAVADLCLAVAALAATGSLALKADRRFLPALAIAFIAIQSLDLGRVAWPLTRPFSLTESLWPADIRDAMRLKGGRVGVFQRSSGLNPHSNQGLAWGIPMAAGYEPTAPRRYSALLRIVDAELKQAFAARDATRPTSPVADLIGLRWMIAEEANTDADLDSTRKALAGSWTTRERDGAMPRVWIVEDFSVFDDWESVSLALAGRPFDPRLTALLEQYPPNPPDVNLAPAEEGEAWAAIVAETLHRVEIAFNAPEGGLLLLADRHDPDWKVFMNGVDAPMIRANGFMRAAPLRSGSGTATFVYRPRAVRIGVAVSGAALILCFAALIAHRRRRLKSTGNGRP